MSKKRIIILCLTLIMCFPLTAFAAANVGVSKIPPIINDTGIIKPDSTSTPSKKSVYDTSVVARSYLNYHVSRL